MNSYWLKLAQEDQHEFTPATSQQSLPARDEDEAAEHEQVVHTTDASSEEDSCLRWALVACYTAWFDANSFNEGLYRNLETNIFEAFADMEVPDVVDVDFHISLRQILTVRSWGEDDGPSCLSSIFVS